MDSQRMSENAPVIEHNTDEEYQKYQSENDEYHAADVEYVAVPSSN